MNRASETFTIGYNSGEHVIKRMSYYEQKMNEGPKAAANEVTESDYTDIKTKKGRYGDKFPGTQKYGIPLRAIERFPNDKNERHMKTLPRRAEMPGVLFSLRQDN